MPGDTDPSHPEADDPNLPPGPPVTRSASATGGEPAAALFREYARTHDLEVRNRLIRLYEPLVHYVARRFATTAGTTLEDVVQVGYLGLIQAIERFEPERGLHFSTFATPTILGCIKHYLRDHAWCMKAPRRLQELGQKAQRLAGDLEVQLGRAPTLTELAAAAEASEERLVEALEVARLQRLMSLDLVVQREAGELDARVAEAVGWLDPALGRFEERAALDTALARLHPRQQQIIRARYLEGASQEKIAARLGISQMHVSRLERTALRLLRRLLTSGEEGRTLPEEVTG
jgi:RNA polymerase sigma-B factor